MSGCPFGGGSTATSPRPLQEANRGDTSPTSPKPFRAPTGRARIKLLYEEYVHLPLLRQVWEQPSTTKPVLEPLFAAGFHGIELAFLLLAEFVSDGRKYVAKRPRVELVAEDIAAQCQLLTEVVDAELEEELQEGACVSRLSLTQPFPFEGCPPTKAEAGHSPGLQRLTDAVQSKIGSMSAAERNSLIKLVLNITAACSSFQRWTVGLGIEPQLNALRGAVGLPALQFSHTLNLDYDSLVKPWLCEQTLTCEKYTHPEDFFFRTIHLGTDCWAFIALSRLRSARQLAEEGNWHVAAARATQASRILDYLGSHVMLLTSMNLRDYLLLKVELEGTSGEGSVQVKSFRPMVCQLFEPLAGAVLGCSSATAAAAAAAACGVVSKEEGKEQGPELRAVVEELQEALMGMYEFPDRQSGLYNYCKALEALETGLLGGFFYRHYCLATNVIGSEARGTMKRAVAALKAGYEVPVFPLLDTCRVALGARIDAEVAHNKGRMMDEIMARYHQRYQAGSTAGAEAASTTDGFLAPASTVPAGKAAAGGGCPFASRSLKDGSMEQQQAQAPSEASSGAAGFEAARQKLYGWEEVPAAFKQMVSTELEQQASLLGLVPHSGQPYKPLAFLDHAWGQVSPLAQYRAWREAAALWQLGNSAWDACFGRVLPQAAAHIRSLLGLSADSSSCSVQFGSNSHELVGRLLSAAMDRQGERETQSQKIHVLTSDTEFYSFTRQINRFVEAGLAVVHTVPAEPAVTFTDRYCAAVEEAVAGRQYDMLYVSQITYLSQQCLVPSIPDFVRRVRAAAGTDATTTAAPAGLEVPCKPEPLLCIDGYHGFAALPTDLAEVAEDCCYVSGLLKHVGCGANCAFLTLPSRLDIRPVNTGWLADPSVLAPGSSGVHFGSEVGYAPDLALQGGTPSYMLPLLTFNHLMQLWQHPAGGTQITVGGLHSHVMHLHERFLERLDAAGHPSVNTQTLVPPCDPSCRSHTLVFAQDHAATAKHTVDALARQGIQVDCRKAFVRVGFGANHSMSDVDALLSALKAAGTAGSA